MVVKLCKYQQHMEYIKYLDLQSWLQCWDFEHLYPIQETKLHTHVLRKHYLCLLIYLLIFFAVLWSGDRWPHYHVIGNVNKNKPKLPNMAKTITACSSYMDSGQAFTIVLQQHMYTCKCRSTTNWLWHVYIWWQQNGCGNCLGDADHLVPFPYHGSHTHL